MKTRDATQASVADNAPLERATLLVGSATPRVFEICEGESIVFGRGAECDVRLDDETLSRRHASLVLERGRLVLRDLNSRNGVKVSGVTLRDGSRELAAGASFRLGKTDVFVTVPRGESAMPLVTGAEMSAVALAIEKFAPTDLSVLLLGETGVGKEVVASAIHARSRRASRAFVALHCAALPEAVLESELFGHERGAFTGADKRRIGWLESSAGGTLFLDEIGDLPAAAQVKLLRFLETKRLSRLGSNDEIEVDARLIAATHRDLERDVARGKFREDLYYRIATCVVRVPPLRERKSEIPLLAAHFAEGAAKEAKRAVPAFGPGFFAALDRHAWPGNVRELRNAIEHAVATCTTTLTPDALPSTVIGRANAATRGVLQSDVESLERESIEHALTIERGNRTHAAKRLGLSRRALLYKLKKYKLA